MSKESFESHYGFDNSPDWIKEVDLPVEDDHGKLLSTLNEKMKFNPPKSFYQYLNPQNASSFFPLKGKYIALQSEHPERNFGFLSKKYPERYAACVFAWLQQMGEITTDETLTSLITEKMKKCIINNEPIKFAMTYSLQKFPLSSQNEDIKTSSLGPDLAELSMLSILWNIGEIIKSQVYPPGVHYRILNESKPFKHFPSPYSNVDLDKFVQILNEWITKMSWGKTISIGDLEEECMKKPSYMVGVDEKFKQYYQQFLQQGIDNPFIRAETRNIYLPALTGANIDKSTLLRIYSAGGILPIPGMSCAWDLPTTNDRKLWEKIVAQATVQASYFKAYLDTRNNYGGVYQEDEIAVTVTESGNKITLPVCDKGAQEEITHWNRGIKVFPSAGTGVLTKHGIGIAPFYKAEKESNKIMHSKFFNLYYLCKA